MTILLIAIAIFYGIFAWKNFQAALSLLPALLPLYLIRTSIGPVPTTLLELLFLSLFTIAIIKKKFGIRDSGFGIPILIFLFAASIGIFISPDKISALGIWKAYFLEPVIFFFLVSQNLKEEKYLRLLLRALLLSALIISLWAIIQYFTGWGIPEPWVEERRVTGPYPYPNAVGLFLAPLFIFFLYMKRYMGEFWKKAVALSLPLMLAAIMLAKTESALVAVTVVLGAMIIRAQKAGLQKRIAGILFIIAALFLIFQPAFVKPVTEKLLLRDWSGIVRRITWNESLEMLKDRPIFGAGLSGYQKTIAPYHKATAIEIFLYPHNIFLNFWSELGLLGLGAFAWIITRFFIYTKKLLSKNGLEKSIAMAAGGAMAVMLIHGLVDVPYFKNDLAMLFWLIAAMPVIAEKLRGTD